MGQKEMVELMKNQIGAVAEMALIFFRATIAAGATMEEAFQDADIVYPKSWAPFAAMEKRTDLYAQGDSDGIKALEQELLAQNAEHKGEASAGKACGVHIPLEGIRLLPGDPVILQALLISQNIIFHHLIRKTLSLCLKNPLRR